MKSESQNNSYEERQETASFHNTERELARDVGYKQGYQDALQEAAPNPDKSRWELLDKMEYYRAYVLKVRYFDCTNFEGVKIMVYEGQYKMRKCLDPHFQPLAWSPFARFAPTEKGWLAACKLAMTL